MRYQVDVERVVSSIATIEVEAGNDAEARAKAVALAPAHWFPVGHKQHYILNTSVAIEYGAMEYG